MPKDNKALTIIIRGKPRSGKTSAMWMLINQLETFGATVIVGPMQEKPELVDMMRARDHNMRPGMMSNLTVHIEQETLDEDDYDDAETTS